MTDPSNSTALTTQKTAHTAVTVGGVTFNAAIAGQTVWSRASASAALANGTITQAQYILVSNLLTNYEQTQIDASRDAQRGTYLASD